MGRGPVLTAEPSFRRTTAGAEQLMAYFYRRTLDPEASADLVAETIATAYLRRNHYRKRSVPVTAWLYGIASRNWGSSAEGGGRRVVQ